jgi:transposase
MYLAFELSMTKWKLGFSTGFAQKARIRNITGGDLKQLNQEIREAKKRFGLPVSSQVVSCYEASRHGFWLHRWLESSGVENRVVDSSSIEVNRRARRAKSDTLDVQKLLTMLMRYEGGERKLWSVVRVPTIEQEDARHVHRQWRTWRRERTRLTNRMKGLLASQGIRISGRPDLSDSSLERMRCPDGRPLPPGLAARLRWEWESLEFVNKQMRCLQREQRKQLKQSDDASMEQIQRLMMLRGIGRTGAWVLVQEFFSWRRFRNGKQIGALAGLTPTPFQSGADHREQGISKAGNCHIRAVATQLAWGWLRHQPNSRLSLWYKRRFADGGPRARKVGIVGLARRLLIDLWRYLDTGLLPEGAELKASS